MPNPQRAKSLCNRPRDLGYKVTIEFHTDHRANTPNENQSNSTQDINVRLGDDTIVWYDLLEKAEKQIKGLRLHESLGHPPFVVLSMNDGSFLLFELALTADDAYKNLMPIDVIRLTDLDVEGLTLPSIQVDFLPTPDDQGTYIDLKFAIAVCYGLFDHIVRHRSDGYSIPMYQRLFALSLFMSVVRHRLPISGSLLKKTSTIVTVDRFCRETLSQEHAGQFLWVDSVIKKAQDTVNQGIREAAIARIEGSVLAADSPWVPVNNEGENKWKTHVATLIVAWLESMANKGKLSVSNSWNREWDKTWRSEWKSNWIKNWSTAPGSIHARIDRDQFVHELRETTVLSGKAAGRAMIECTSVVKAIDVDQPPKTTVQNKEPGTSSIQAGCISSNGPPFPGLRIEEQVQESAPVITEPEDANDQVPNLVKKLPAQIANKCNWFNFWYSSRRPDLKQQVKWLPVCEAASNMAWALGWKNQFENSKDENGDVGIVPPASDFFSRLFSELFNRSQAEVATPHSGAITPNLQELSEAAWIEAYNSDPNLGEYVKEKGKEVFETLKKEMESKSRGMKAPSEEQCAKVFEDTLRQTWQTCWKGAWERVMKDTKKELNDWNYATSDRTEASDIQLGKLTSYGALCKYIKKNDLEESHWAIRSTFKASNLLHRTMKYSIPKCYEEVMTIHYFPDRPFELTIPNPGPSSKYKRLNKAIHLDRKQVISYKELELQIKHLARAHRNRAPKFPNNHSALEKIEDIWTKANSVVTTTEFLSNKDVTGPRPQQMASAMRHLESKHSIMPTTWARHMWHRIINDIHKYNILESAQPTDSASTTENV